MDDLEILLHQKLMISVWKDLKEKAFYSKKSIVSNFNCEYQLQYLHYTTYLKLYSALTNIENLGKSNLLNLIMNLMNAINDVFSVCDLLSAQIYIAYFNRDIFIDSIGKRINLHSLCNINVKERVQCISNNKRLPYERLFQEKIEPLAKGKSWYNDLKYYRNKMTHGIIRIMKKKDDMFYILKTDCLENNFEKIIRNLPIHNKNPIESDKDEINQMFSDIQIVTQCMNYFNGAKELSIAIWENILKLYEETGCQVSWKL